MNDSGHLGYVKVTENRKILRRAMNFVAKALKLPGTPKRPVVFRSWVAVDPEDKRGTISIQKTHTHNNCAVFPLQCETCTVRLAYRCISIAFVRNYLEVRGWQTEAIARQKVIGWCPQCVKLKEGIALVSAIVGVFCL